MMAGSLDSIIEHEGHNLGRELEKPNFLMTLWSCHTSPGPQTPVLRLREIKTNNDV